MKCLIVLGVPTTIEEHYDFLVGVDRGAYYLASEGMSMDLALGDFDSVSEAELKLIQQYAAKIQKIPAIKDITDSEYAVETLADKGFTEIIIAGGLGKRFDHSLVNLKLLEKYPHLILKDDYNWIKIYENGYYEIDKNDYQYLSFIPLSKGAITIKDVKYPLYDRKIDVLDTYLISNEIIGEVARLTIEGKVLLLKTRD